MSIYMKENGQLVKGAGLYKKSVPVGLADIYSEEERVVGCWLDGKPLYQRTITIDTIASSLGVQRFAHNVANIETAFAISGTWLQKSDDSIYIGTKDIIRTDGSGNINIGRGSVGVWVDTTNIIIDTSENRSSQYLVVTFQYTKTTDMPWSGIVPQGYGYVSSGDIYSFEERQVGVYIDGKPLYQKTIKVPASSLTASETSLAHGIADVDYIYAVGGVALKAGNGSTPLLTYHSNTAWASGIYNISRTSYTFYAGTSLKPYITELDVTFKYTKTTDVAGSGEYIPSGDKAVHYDDTEQVIGTWFGETLYRKSFKLPNTITFASNSWADTGVTVQNISRVIDGKVLRNGTQSFALSVNIDNNTIKVQSYYSGTLTLDSNTYITLEYTKATS